MKQEVSKDQSRPNPTALTSITAAVLLLLCLLSFAFLLIMTGSREREVEDKNRPSQQNFEKKKTFEPFIWSGNSHPLMS